MRRLGYDVAFTVSNEMKTLFIFSVASGYGGAERSIEIMLHHLPSDVCVRIYAVHPKHMEQLAGIDAANLRVLRVLRGDGALTRKLNALRMAFDVWRWRPSAVLVNTHFSACLAA